MQSCSLTRWCFGCRRFIPEKNSFSYLTKEFKFDLAGRNCPIIGGVPVPENIKELTVFFDEMELLLMKKRIIHFFPKESFNLMIRNCADLKKSFPFSHRSTCTVSAHDNFF